MKVSRVIKPIISAGGNFIALEVRVGRAGFDEIPVKEVRDDWGKKCKIPRKKYRVTYETNPKGYFTIPSYCFVPEKMWDERGTRTVEILE